MSSTDWEERRKQGLVRFLIFDGVVKMGCPFAVVMQIVGVFILRDEGQSFGQYMAQPRTWVTFFLHATLFGLVMGFITWYRNERGPRRT